MRRLFLALAASALLLMPAQARAQDEGTGNNDNAGVAVNTKDGSDVFRLAFAIDRIMRPDADSPDNAAVAYGSCEACKTTAIAIQVVLYMTPPEGDFTPTNMAFAINEGCTSCETVALAYQIVLQTDGPVRLTPEGQREIARILNEIRDLDDLDLPPGELDARTDALVDELAGVFNEELQPIGQRTVEDTDADIGSEPGEDPGAEASFDPSQTSTPDTTEDPLGSPAPSADASPSTSDAPATSEAPAATP
jgi:putative peptide zinc metalloprotease protein